jgi:LuxR family quorum sensing-dependent transcriptional regulator
MLLTNTGFQLVEHLERQRGVPALLASFQRLVLAFGMEVFWIGDASQPEIERDNRRWGATFPVGWYWRYVSQNHLPHDPVVARMNRSPDRFRWSDTYESATARDRQVLDEAAEFGFHDGLAIPIHQADGGVAGVSIAARTYDLSQQDELALHMAALYLHAKVSGLRAGAATTPAPRLTPRERECLQWVAAGKTDWEISQILSISEQTAHGYVQNALRKLGARTRAQAVALALLSSQIQQ